MVSIGVLGVAPQLRLDLRCAAGMSAAVGPVTALTLLCRPLVLLLHYLKKKNFVRTSWLLKVFKGCWELSRFTSGNQRWLSGAVRA